MKRILIGCLLLVGIGLSQSASAQDETSEPIGTGSAYRTALGVRLSSSNAKQNNSISIKQFITQTTAIEGLFTFGDPLALGALVEFHKPLAPAGLTYFYGAGGYLAFEKVVNPNTHIEKSETNIGGQGIIGLDYKFAGIPLNLSLDWKPELNIVPDINFEPAAIGFSARFTFGK